MLAGSKGRKLGLQIVAVVIVVEQLMAVGVVTAIIAIILGINIAASRRHLLFKLVLFHKILISFIIVLFVIGYYGWEL